MIDLWAHTEEVVTPEQVAAWGQVVRYAAQQRDTGALWIAPLAEIAAWQQALRELRIEDVELKNSEAGALAFNVINGSDQDLNGLTLRLPFTPKQITVDGNILNSQFSILNLDVRAGQTVAVVIWPA